MSTLGRCEQLLKYYYFAADNFNNIDQIIYVHKSTQTYIRNPSFYYLYYLEGVRHLEVDIWWGPISREIEVCHSPGTVTSILNVCSRRIDVEFSIVVFVCLNLHTVCSK